MRKEIYLLIGLNLAFFFANNVDRYLCHDLSCGKIEALIYKSVSLNVVFVLYIWLFKAEKKEIVEQVDENSSDEETDQANSEHGNNSISATKQKHLSAKPIQSTMKIQDAQITFKSEMHPNRTVLCRDSIRWLNEQKSIDYVVTSLPDHSEMKFTLDQWKSWFVSTAALILSKLSDDGLALFYQTDCRITDNKTDHVTEWVDKSFLIQTAAVQSNCKLLWHKVMLKGGPELVNGRPSYSHLLCFSKNLNDKLMKVSPDVAHRGKAVWKRGMGYHSTFVAVEFIRQYCPQPNKATIVDPFCGHGTVLAVANYLGFNSIGIDCMAKFCKAAVKLTATDQQLLEIKNGSSKEEKED
jgi:hypothetical protein